jgi:hypothetical protein
MIFLLKFGLNSKFLKPARVNSGFCNPSESHFKWISSDLSPTCLRPASDLPLLFLYVPSKPPSSIPHPLTMVNRLSPY